MLGVSKLEQLTWIIACVSRPAAKIIRMPRITSENMVKQLTLWTNWNTYTDNVRTKIVYVNISK